MKKHRKKRYCISCGCVLSPIEDRICFGCALIAALGGNKPELKEAQKEVWRRCLQMEGIEELKEKM
ncbi:MAG: hypothetical protein J7J46_05765 [Candidatus Desulfofervidus sp.]|nr:hypothetical protein [Candidatus Desulfofervidus sp.]